MRGQILQTRREEYTRRLVARARRRPHFRPARRRDGRSILAIDHVSASYPGKPRVIDDVSLEVRKGDTVAVVGESGLEVDARAHRHGFCRETRAMCAITAQAFQRVCKDRSIDQLRRVQMIYQMPDVALNPQHTLLEAIGRPVAFYFLARSARCAHGSSSF